MRPDVEIESLGQCTLEFPARCARNAVTRHHTDMNRQQPGSFTDMRLDRFDQFFYFAAKSTGLLAHDDELIGA